ncbi:hypothetical protein O3M35_008958 [Rhynocoris fuscipes]|uniref:Calcium signal-modulating cyclophilin ligand n=1 Tax=Rhynocoris fuscipes TaxID=488301 RepID=A0AAW1D1C1_9HEMI
MDLRARMEERRRKILENSEARMSKILGRPYVAKESIDQIDRPSTSYSLSNGIANGSIAGTSSVYPESSHYSTAEEEPRLLGYTDTRTTEETTDYAHKITSFSEYFNALIFIALGFIARLSYLLGFSWMFSQNLMLPFFLVGIPWTYIQCKGQMQAVGMLPTILLYVGLPQVTVIKLCQLIAFFRTLTQYFSLYLFCFIILHCTLDSLTAVNT